MTISSGTDACGNAFGTSTIATSRPSFASITDVKKTDSSADVGYVTVTFSV